MIFIGISTWSWCYALWSSLAFPHEPDATLYDLQLQFHMIWCYALWSIGISTWTWCYALWSSIGISTFPHLDATLYDLQLAFPHELDATLYALQLQFHIILMLRSMIFTGISTWTWCYALCSSIAIPHNLDATLYDLHWHFHMNLMLRSMVFNCNSTWSWCYVLWSSNGISTWSWCYVLWSSVGISPWTWCYALWSSLAFPHEPDATLYDLQLQFHMILMLRSMIFNWHFHMILMLRSMLFNCNSTWSWCYVLWSSIAIPHDLDAALYDLHWHFHMNLDATLYDLQCEKKLRLPFLRLQWWKGCSFPK